MANPADPLQDTPKTTRINKHTMACSLIASLSCFFSGYYISAAPEFVKEVADNLKFSATEANISNLCAPLWYLLGALTAARMANCISRRCMLLFSGIFIFVGSVLMVSATNFASFMVGLFCFAFGAVNAKIVAPLYIAEMTPVSSVRGFLTSLPETFDSVGTLLGGVAIDWLPKISTHSGWRFMVGIAAVPSVFLCIGLFAAISETPYWLVMKDRLDDAKRILDKISVSLEVSQLRLEGMRNAANIPDENNQGNTSAGAVPVVSDKVSARKKIATYWIALKELLIHPTPSVRHMLVTALALHFLQQATGGYTVIVLSTDIFKQVGVRISETHNQFISYAFGLTGILSNLVAAVLVDKIGRRALLLYSLPGMAFSLIGLSTGLTIIQDHPQEKFTWTFVICIACSLSHTVFFSIGIGPIAWIYSSEVFPTRLRSVAVGIAGTLNFFTGLIVNFSFFYSLDLITSGPGFRVSLLFFPFAGIASLGWIFIYLFLPETKGVSLEEMETVFPGLGSLCVGKIRNSICHTIQNR